MIDNDYKVFFGIPQFDLICLINYCIENDLSFKITERKGVGLPICFMNDLQV